MHSAALFSVCLFCNEPLTLIFFYAAVVFHTSKDFLVTFDWKSSVVGLQLWKHFSIFPQCEHHCAAAAAVHSMMSRRPCSRGQGHVVCLVATALVSKLTKLTVSFATHLQIYHPALLLGPRVTPLRCLPFGICGNRFKNRDVFKKGFKKCSVLVNFLRFLSFEK